MWGGARGTPGRWGSISASLPRPPAWDFLVRDRSPPALQPIRDCESSWRTFIPSWSFIPEAVQSGRVWGLAGAQGTSHEGRGQVRATVQALHLSPCHAAPACKMPTAAKVLHGLPAALLALLSASFF